VVIVVEAKDHISLIHEAASPRGTVVLIIVIPPIGMTAFRCSHSIKNHGEYLIIRLTTVTLRCQIMHTVII
jgi:hypothetical protein